MLKAKYEQKMNSGNHFFFHLQNKKDQHFQVKNVWKQLATLHFFCPYSDSFVPDFVFVVDVQDMITH